MWTGRQTLSSIESAIANLHSEEGQLDAALRSAVGETERLRKERSEALRELARIKLDEMAAGRLVSSLDAGERRAVQILDDYRLRIAATAERREALLKEVAAAETQRNAAAAAVEEALAAVEAIRADTEAKVQAASAWQAAKGAFGEAEAVASEAEKKAASSEAELGAKRKPYDDDPLFTYLWSRKFGTRDYQGGNFARLMDRIVADFIGFNDVRANYAALIEIPLRLREHATAKRAEAAERQGALSEVERRAMIEAGIEPKERPWRRRATSSRRPTRRSRRSTGCCARSTRSARRWSLAAPILPTRSSGDDRVRRQQGRPGPTLSGGATDAHERG